MIAHVVQMPAENEEGKFWRTAYILLFRDEDVADHVFNIGVLNRDVFNR